MHVCVCVCARVCLCAPVHVCVKHVFQMETEKRCSTLDSHVAQLPVLRCLTVGTLLPLLGSFFQPEVHTYLCWTASVIILRYTPIDEACVCLRISSDTCKKSLKRPSAVVCWLLNVPATCLCISGMDLLRQLNVLSHWYRSCRSNFLSQSQYTDAGPTSPSMDSITPGAWQGCHWSTNFKVTDMTTWKKIHGESRNWTQVCRSQGHALTTQPMRQ